MSISALFFNFSKRKNSLKVPVDNTGTTFNVVLKQPCSYQEPVLTLSNSGFSYNYAKFEGSYYFVSDIVSLRAGLWEVHLKKDVLATWRTEILSTSAFILYDETANSELTDTRLSIDTGPTYQTNSEKFTTLGTASQYTAIVGITGTSMSGTNTTGLYAMSLSTLSSLLANMYTWYSNTGLPDIQWSSILDTPEVLSQIGDFIVDATRQLITSSGGVAENIKSCTLIPVPLSSLQGTSQRIYLGLYDSGVDALKIDMDPFVDTCTIQIPWQANDWRRNSPYHEFYLTIPFIGTINISPSVIMGRTQLVLYMYVDVSDGTATIVIYKNFSTDDILGVYTASLGGNYLVGSSGVTAARGLTAIAGTGASIITATAAGSAIPLAGAIPAIMNNITPQSTAIGSCGGLSSIDLLRLPVTLTSVFHDTNIIPSSVNAVMGTPTMAVKTISALTGYVQTSNFSLEAACPDEDRNIVNNFMDSGVFIE